MTKKIMVLVLIVGLLIGLIVGIVIGLKIQKGVQEEYFNIITESKTYACIPFLQELFEIDSEDSLEVCGSILYGDEWYD